MLKVFLELLSKADAVLVGEQGESKAKGVPPLRRAQTTVSPETGDAENQVVHLFYTANNKPRSLILTEEGITYGYFDVKAEEFVLVDHTGVVMRVRLVVDGQALCPPAGYEKLQGPAFLVIQEGGSSSEFYAHCLITRAQARKYQDSAWRSGSYRTSNIIEVPTSLADHPDFMEIAVEIARASMNMAGGSRRRT